MRSGTTPSRNMRHRRLSRPRLHSRNHPPWNTRAAPGGQPPSATARDGAVAGPARTSMFHRFGLRPDVLVPLVLATATLPLGLLLPVVHFSWALKTDTTFSVLTGTFDLLGGGHTFIGLLILTFSII